MHYYVDGVKVSEFRGDERRSKDRERGARFLWLGQTPYAGSAVYDFSSSKFSTMYVWDVARGQKLCELPDEFRDAQADKLGNLYNGVPVMRVSLPDCKPTPVVSSGNGADRQTSWQITDNGTALRVYYNTGRVDVIDVANGQVRATIQPPVPKPPQDFYARFTSAPGLPPRYAFASATGSAWQLLDLQNGRVLATYDQSESPPTVAGDYVLLSTKKGELRRTRVWKLGLEDGAQVSEFLAAMQKDKYETTSDFQKRVQAFSTPYSMKVALQDYNADRGSFDAAWRGVPLQVPMSPAQARQFAGMKEMTLSGDLRALDEDFLELRKVSVTAPGGQNLRLALPEGRLVPPRAASGADAADAVVNAKGKTKGSAPKAVASGASAWAPSTGGGCASTLTYLEPRIRAYTAPALAKVRRELFAINVSSSFSEMRRKGETASSLLQQADEYGKAARQAADTANGSDGRGTGVSIAQADSNTLPLNWPCEGIHSSAVCAYIADRWGELAMRELARQFTACGN